ncbi:hypothetical protein HF086_012349 [Spodoptera exigua]|uniref:Fibronectin type-III domain-containing protein n=1 Tax=Spodoptera exigua TaxID=7107 RepID=A0A922M9Y1_SPOEX|nr:hypothetical protein HF086_012349 [Spodoptera exigua]
MYMSAARAGRDWISVWWGAAQGGVLVRGLVLGWGLGVPDDAARELPPSTLTRHPGTRNSRGLGPAVYATVRTKPPADDEDEPEDEDEEDEDEEDEPPPLIPPVGVKVIMLSGTTAVVYWTDPTLPKGQTATDGRRYVVRWSSAGGRARTFNATDLNCMLDDLKPYTHYEFAVKLIKGGRESAWSMIVSNTTLETAPGSAPRDLRVSPAAPPASAARAVDLVWQPPAKPNGVITGYVIMYAVSGPAPQWTAVAAPGERPRARVERLRPRTSYLFKLQARNSKGLGPFCAPVGHATGAEAGAAGLAGATSAWLWASAGGALAVLALAAALALSLCCRRPAPPPRPTPPPTTSPPPPPPSSRPTSGSTTTRWNSSTWTSRCTAPLHPLTYPPCRSIGGQRGGRSADVVDADAGARAPRGVRAGAAPPSPRLPGPPPPRAHIRRETGPGSGSGGPIMSGGPGLGPGGGSLQRRGAGPAGGALHSFTLSDNASDTSTPSHSRASVRETSPYKKSASSSPGHIPNRLQLATEINYRLVFLWVIRTKLPVQVSTVYDCPVGGAVPHCADELEPLTPSRSTERLHREMQNLEGLMKDLSAITQQQFHC